MGQLVAKDSNGGADPAQRIVSKRHPNGHPIQEIMDAVTDQNHPHHRLKIPDAKLLLGVIGGRWGVIKLVRQTFVATIFVVRSAVVIVLAIVYAIRSSLKEKLFQESVEIKIRRNWYKILMITHRITSIKRPLLLNAPLLKMVNKINVPSIKRAFNRSNRAIDSQ